MPRVWNKKNGDHSFHDYGKYRVGYYLGKKRKSTLIGHIRHSMNEEGNSGTYLGSPMKMIEGIEKLDEVRIDAIFLLK